MALGPWTVLQVLIKLLIEYPINYNRLFIILVFPSQITIQNKDKSYNPPQHIQSCLSSFYQLQFIQSQYRIMRMFGKLLIIVFICLGGIQKVESVIYCSSFCTAGTCSGQNASTCSTYVYNVLSLPNTTTQMSLFTSELSFYTNFTPQNYLSSSTLSTSLCTHSALNYYTLGTISSGYIYKQFTGLGTNHFKISIYYGYSLLGGSWSSPILNLQVKDNKNPSLNQVQASLCTSQTFSGCSLTGCFSNEKFQSQVHSSDFVSLNFSNITSVPAGLLWGINQLYIVLHLCHVSCLTCSDATMAGCLTCSSGSYLSGNTCVSTCPYYTLISSNECVVACPDYYYLNTLNNYCQGCPSGCQTCKEISTCLIWASNQDPSSYFHDLINLWIILSALGLFFIGLIIWKICISRKSNLNEMEEEIINQKPVQVQQNDYNRLRKISNTLQSLSNVNNGGLYIDDIDDLHMTKIDTRPTRISNKIDGIGHKSTQHQDLSYSPQP